MIKEFLVVAFPLCLSASFIVLFIPLDFIRLDQQSMLLVWYLLKAFQLESLGIYFLWVNIKTRSGHKCSIYNKTEKMMINKHNVFLICRGMLEIFRLLNIYLIFQSVNERRTGSPNISSSFDRII